jgi:hypothetical protein
MTEDDALDAGVETPEPKKEWVPRGTLQWPVRLSSS